MRRGFLLVGLAVAAALVATWTLLPRGGDGAATGDGTAGLLVVGIDGADWAVIDPLMEQGRMPNLGRLVASGVRAKLLSVSPMLSPVIWTTVATGVEPTRHGVLDFVVQAPDGSRQPVTSAQREVPTVWEILSRSGIEVGVVGWWASWPADPVRGYVVSDRVAYQLFGYRADPRDARGKTWPPDLYGSIRELIVRPADVAWERVQPYLDGPRREFEQFTPGEREMLDGFRTLLAAGESYLAMAQFLGRRKRPRLEVVYFEGTDTVGHLFMPYRPPRLEGNDPATAESFASMVERYYETADRYLGELLHRRGSGVDVMVLSDHGFATDTTRPRTTDSRIGHGTAADWHRRFGVLVLAGPSFHNGAILKEATVYDIAPTILALFGQPVPRSWPGRVLEDALTEAFLAANPLRSREEDPPRAERAAASRWADPAAVDLLERLRALGYVGGGDDRPDGSSAQNNAGLSLVAQGRFVEAEQEFRAALATGPRAGILLVNLAVCLRHEGRVAEAVVLLREAAEDPRALRLAGHQLAQIALDAGDLDEAERRIRSLLEREPDAAEVRNTLGLILESRGELDGASREFLAAAQADPHAAMARNNLGNLEKRYGDPGQAENWYLRAIEADPYFMGSYNNLALAYQERGRFEEAIDLYDRALAKSPENPTVLNNLASLLFDSGRDDEAAELWGRAAAAAPDYPSPLNNLAGLEIVRGRLDAAEALLARALELDPGYGDARINLAHVLRGRGDVEGARRELRRASDDSRSGVLPWAQLGRLELEVGTPGAAVEAWLHVLAVNAQDTQALNALGEAYHRQGKRAEALESWRRSLAIEADQPQLRLGLEMLEAQP